LKKGLGAKEIIGDSVPPLSTGTMTSACSPLAGVCKIFSANLIIRSGQKGDLELLLPSPISPSPPSYNAQVTLSHSTEQYGCLLAAGATLHTIEQFWASPAKGDLFTVQE
jgi:hypothetical protein